MKVLFVSICGALLLVGCASAPKSRTIASIPAACAGTGRTYCGVVTEAARAPKMSDDCRVVGMPFGWPERDTDGERVVEGRCYCLVGDGTIQGPEFMNDNLGATMVDNVNIIRKCR